MEGNFKDVINIIGVVIVIGILLAWKLGKHTNKIKSIFKWLIASMIGLLISLYTSFVAMSLWNWFAVRALNINNISFFEMLGIVWLIGIFTSRADKDEMKWKLLFSAVEACVPDENREMLAMAIEEHKENIWADAFAAAFGQITGNTLTLALGFGLHILMG